MMEDSELQKLRQITPPAPRDEAKRHAMQAALQAFEAAAQPPAEKKATIFQGLLRRLRLIHSINQELWSLMMKKQLIAGTALASVMALTVTTLMWQQEDLVAPQTLQAKKSRQLVAQGQQETLAGRGEQAQSLSANDRLEEIAAAPVAPPPLAMPEPAQLNYFAGRPQGRSRQALKGAPYLEATDAAREYEIHQSRDAFEAQQPNPVKQVSQEPVSTFSVDVDTASYSFVRKALNSGHLPQKNAVRVEELINYFDYDYPLADNPSQPFRPSVAVYPAPWSEHTKLLHIGIKGHDVILTEKPPANLVFLLDVSGSMNSPDKLPLLKNAFRMMVDHLQPSDTVSIVTYAGSEAVVLEPTKVSEKAVIFSALEQLRSGGSTAGAQGIKRAYDLAQQHFDEQGVNRVILATDGDFNVGITDREELKGFIERKRDSGIFLSVLGFGRGNYNDALMQALAQNGNGNAAYIDTLNEARKVLVDEASSTLFPIAKDVKIQIEFNPNAVAEYRLIGYESRMLKREDFNNDKVDAGDIGSGHTVTAIYEITPVGSKARFIDGLRYQKKHAVEVPSDAEEYAFLKLRYKLPEQSVSQLIELPIDAALEKDTIADVSAEMRFAAGVAAFGQLLKQQAYLGEFTYDDVLNLVKDARGDDAFGYRSEFLNLVRLAKTAKAM